jgi:hypothetical protein
VDFDVRSLNFSAISSAASYMLLCRVRRAAIALFARGGGISLNQCDLSVKSSAASIEPFCKALWPLEGSERRTPIKSDHCHFLAKCSPEQDLSGIFADSNIKASNTYLGTCQLLSSEALECQYF